MWIFPAIDLVDNKAVRLVRGDYARMTVYSEDPLSTAQGFCRSGAKYLHTVDLQGAKSGSADHFPLIASLIEKSGLNIEIGGGIRTMETVDRYMAAGAWRVILGTAAVDDPRFLEDAVEKYGPKVAVGVDIREGRVMTRGWLEDGGIDCDSFCQRLQELGVCTVICTDIARDGMMGGANTQLYARLTQTFPRLDFVASGGVSGYEDITRLRDMGLYGAIVGKALYTGSVDLSKAIELAGEGEE